jgi:hypothetical protein
MKFFAQFASDKHVDQIAKDHGGALEEHDVSSISLTLDHVRIDGVGDFGQQQLKICEERGVIEGPYRFLIKVPIRVGFLGGNTHPVLVHVKIGAVTRALIDGRTM